MKRIERTEAELRIKAGISSYSYRSFLKKQQLSTRDLPKKWHNTKIMPNNLRFY